MQDAFTMPSHDKLDITTAPNHNYTPIEYHENPIEDTTLHESPKLQIHGPRTGLPNNFNPDNRPSPLQFLYQNLLGQRPRHGDPRT